MNTKLRALLWEECRTGGVIAAWTTMVSLVAMLAIRAMTYSDLVPGPIMVVALGCGVVVSLLLLYRTGNSGHLSGGFSGRILLLPVETRHAVVAILMARTGLVFAATLIALVGSRLICGFGPSWFCLLLLPGLYLVAQGLDWLRRPVPLAAGLGLIALLGVIGLGYMATMEATGTRDEGNVIEQFFYTLEELSSFGDYTVPPAVWLLGALLFVVLAAVVYGLSLGVVNLARCGERFQGGLRFRLPEALPLPFGPRNDMFASPRWAYLWAFLRRDGALLPLATLVVGLLLALVTGYLGGMLLATDEGGSLVTGYQGEVIPWAALFLTALFWGGLRGGVGLQRGVRPRLTEYLYPMSSADMAATRLWGQGISLGIAWFGVLLIVNLLFLFGDDALSWRILRQSLAAGETSIRELLHIRLPVAFWVLVAAWVGLVLRTRLFAVMLGTGFLCLVVTGFAVDNAYKSDPATAGVFAFVVFAVAISAGIGYSRVRKRPIAVRQLAWTVPLLPAVYLGATTRDPQVDLAWMLLFLMLFTPAAALVWAWARGLVPPRHLVGCVLAWAGAVLVTYPYAGWGFWGLDRTAVVLGLGIGSALIFPYPALLLDLHRRRHQADSAQLQEEHRHRTSWNLSPAMRGVIGGLALALVVIAIWYCWPAEPPYVEARHEAGKPATVADVAEAYAPGPPEVNAAYHYLEVMRLSSSLEANWEQERLRLQVNIEEVYKAAYDKKNAYTYGSVDDEPDEPVWRGDWQLAQERIAAVDRELVRAVGAIVDADYPQCRFPIDYGSGPAASLHHLAALRSLARSQSMIIWQAAMEDRPEDVLRHLRELAIFAECLRDEPILISQLVRIALHGILDQAAIQALCRTDFTDAQLAEMQSIMSGALPPMAEHSLFDEGLDAEWMYSTSDSTEIMGDFGYGLGVRSIASADPIFTFSRVVAHRCYSLMAANDSLETTPLVAEVEDSSNPFYILPGIMFPALDRSREAEFRARVSHDLVATACAVARYRLAHGMTPESLDVLVPAYLEALPEDPFRPDGGPVSYIPRDDGSYVVYSWGRNGTDEGAEPVRASRTGKVLRSGSWKDGDWYFAVASPGFRDGPQLTEDYVAPE